MILEARLQVLKKQEERLLSFMEGKTNNIQDLLGSGTGAIPGKGGARIFASSHELLK